MSFNLAEAKRALVANPTLEANKIFGKALASAVSRGEWVAVPVVPDARGNKYSIILYGSRPYIVLFSDEEHYHFEQGTRLMMCDINKVIDNIYESPYLEGFVLDPYTASIYITRSQLNDSTARRDPRLERHNWGKGIPDYKPEDLMTDVEVQKFAMQISSVSLLAFTLPMCSILRNHGRIFVVVTSANA